MEKNNIICNFYNVANLKAANDINDKMYIAANLLRKQIQQSAIAPLNIVSQHADINEIELLCDLTSNYQKIIILGVGGSSLGGKTLCALKENDKIDFIESIDPLTLTQKIAAIDFANTFFIVISKSGETTETICQTLIIIDEFKHRNIANFSAQFIFITESLNSTLGKIAQKMSAKITFHAKDIGGRYSCFSIVGMLPALICGLNIAKIRKGADVILKDFIDSDKVINNCIHQIAIYNRGFCNNVIMPYHDILRNFNEWYRQLWAESLGKNLLGSTPINSMGTVDQHSQLQLYLEGKNDKFFTFINCQKRQNDIKINNSSTIATLYDNKLISQILEIEQNTTIESIKQKNLPLRIFNIDNLDEYSLGGLMMMMFIETILIGYYHQINPFDQPAVELRKIMAKNLLQNNV